MAGVFCIFTEAKNIWIYQSELYLLHNRYDEIVIDEFDFSIE